MRQTGYIVSPTVLHGYNIMLHIRHFFPTVPQTFTEDIRDYVCVNSLLKYCNSVYTVCVSGSCTDGSAFMCAIQISVSGRARSEWRKGTPLRKRTNKDHFRCLITIWSIVIARRGLNAEKTWNSAKIDIFHFFVCILKLARVHSDSFCQHRSYLHYTVYFLNFSFELTFLIELMLL